MSVKIHKGLKGLVLLILVSTLVMSPGMAQSPPKIEGEAMATSAATKTSIQNHSQYNWSGNKQLFWQATASGATLDFPFTAPAAGTYSLTLNLTKANDYGNLSFKLNNQPLDRDFAGYNPTVTTAMHSLGDRALLTSNVLTLVITGQDSRSGNYYAGLDYLALTPVASSCETLLNTLNACMQQCIEQASDECQQP